MITAALLAVSLAGAAGDAVVIRVDDLTLTRDDVRARAAEFRGRGVALTADALVENLTAEALLAAEARKLVPPGVAEITLANERQRLLAENYVERTLGKKAPVTEEQLRRIFRQADGIRLKLLIFTSREEALASRNRLAVSGAWSVESAGSVTKGKYPNADTGLTTRALLDPSLAEAAFKAPLNQLTGPVELSLGWAVFSVSQRDVGDEALFAARRAALEPIARSQNLSSIRQHVAEGLRKQAKVQIDEKFVEGLGKRIAPNDAEARHAVATVDGKAITYAEVLPRLRGLGGPEGGHMSGASVKLEIINKFIAERLLANAALGDGLDKSPEVALALRRGALRALANLAADTIRGAQKDPSTREKAIASRVADLRKHARIQTDVAAVAAALVD